MVLSFKDFENSFGGCSDIDWLPDLYQQYLLFSQGPERNFGTGRTPDLGSTRARKEKARGRREVRVKEVLEDDDDIEWVDADDKDESDVPEDGSDSDGSQGGSDVSEDSSGDSGGAANAAPRRWTKQQLAAAIAAFRALRHARASASAEKQGADGEKKHHLLGRMVSDRSRHFQKETPLWKVMWERKKEAYDAYRPVT